MILDNEIKKLSPNRRRRIERRFKRDENLEILLNKNKTQKKKKNKNFDKKKELETELVKMKYAKNPNRF